MGKIKNTREEYRTDYLNSVEWNTLRNLVMKESPDCQCCRKVKARDVHHLVHKNLVNIKIDELLPVCRECHKIIHRAIDDGYISQDPNRFKEIVDKTINILGDQEYEELENWLSGTHSLTDEEIKIISNDNSRFLIKRIRGITNKKLIWIDDLVGIKFTGRQLKKIKELFKTFSYRKEIKKSKKLKINHVAMSDERSKLYKKIKKLKQLQKARRPWLNAVEIDKLNIEIEELRKNM